MAELPFFFDQPKRPLIKRKRRSMEQLPFSLPLTGINGTLKVEAITKQQSKIPNQSTKETLGDSQETDPNGEIQNGDFENNKEKIPSLLPTKTRDNQELPGISVDSCKEKVFVGFDTNPSKDFYEEEEDEDTQRFLFQQNKFAAPNLLAQLGRLLEYFYEKQQEKMDGSVRNKSSDNWANLTSNNLNNTAINLGASYINIHALDIHVPFHLREKLKWNFYQLIANAVYSKREWQTTSYKQQAVSRHRDVGDESVAYDLSSSISIKVKRSQQDSLSMPKKLRKPHDEQNFGPLISETPQNIGKTGSSPSSNTLTDEPTQEIATSVLGFRRESTTPSIPFSAPRTRLEKYKYLPSSNASLLGIT